MINNFLLEFVNYEGKILKRNISLKPNASLYLNKNTDDELKNLLAHHTGWCLVKANTYHLDAYYFSSLGQQIGGDHAY